MTAGVVVGDIAATLMTARRIVAETSALYGYDPNRTADEAYYAYRERRLQDRYGLDPSDRDHDASEMIVDAEVVDDSEEPLDIIGLLDEAKRRSADVDE